MKSKGRFIVGSFCVTAVATTLLACSSSKEKSSAVTTDASAESMLVAYPSQLALSLFTTSSSSSLRVSGDPTTDANAAIEAAEASASRPLKERAGEAEDLLKGAASDCMPDALKRKLPADKETVLCYQFDSDMLVGTMPKRGAGEGVGTANGLDDDDVPCLISFSKASIASINDLLERSQGLVLAALCQQKKEDATAQPPTEVGDSLDLKDALKAAMGENAQNVITAKMERKEDVDSLPVYKSTIEIQEEDLTRTVVLVHSPDDSTETYHGTLYTIELPTQASSLVGAPADTHAHVLSLNYAKVVNGDGFLMQGDLMRARIAPELIDTAMGPTGILDLSSYRDFSVAEGSPKYGAAKKADGTYYNNNEDATQQTHITFSTDPDTDEGTISYAANPGSTYVEAARGIVAQIAIVDGVKKGCAISGAALGKDDLLQGYSIARAQKEGITLDFNGFLHPFFTVDEPGAHCSIVADAAVDSDGKTYYEKTCTSGDTDAKWYQPDLGNTTYAATFASDKAAGYVTRQCYEYDETTGKYKIDTTETPDASGYQVVLSNATGKIVKAPGIDGVKPFEGDVAKQD